MAEKKIAPKSRYEYFGAIIDAKKGAPQIVEDLRGYEMELHRLTDFLFLATIIHDKDIYTNIDEGINPEHKAGTHKMTHLHAFFKVANDKTQGQALKWLAGVLKCDKSQISIEGSNSEVLLCQYLTHQNHKEKAQYSSDLITTSNRERLEQILSIKYEAPISQEETIEKALFDCMSYIEFVKNVGVKEANKYRGTFNQVKQEQRSGARNLEAKYKQLTEDAEMLYKSLAKIINRYERYKTIMADDIEEAKAIIRVYETYYQEIEANN